MSNLKRNQQYVSLLKQTRNLKQQLENLSTFVGYLENSIISRYKQTDSESSSTLNIPSIEVYNLFLLIAVLLKQALRLKSLTGTRGLTCSLNLKHVGYGRNWVLLDTDLSKTGSESELFPTNFESEQLELDLYPGLPK